MSRRDNFHEIVKQALIKEGWTITHDPYIIKSDPKLAIDLGAQRLIDADRGHEKIAVEIKSFLETSQVVDFHNAVGQYSIYNIFLHHQMILIPENPQYYDRILQYVQKLSVQVYIVVLKTSYRY